jgi:GrpB-like predicted nucleotidyltransferase (UPF0157 family)
LALSDTVAKVHHIGSTAIAHTKAKPVIDVLLVVNSIESLDEKSPSLEALGYEVKWELKELLVRASPNDMDAYIKGKDDFVKEHERLALLWRSSGNGREARSLLCLGSKNENCAV